MVRLPGHVFFPFRQLGMTLTKLLSGVEANAVLSELARLWPDQVHCGLYTLTHKVRTFLDLEGQAQKDYGESWIGADSMSAKNKAQFRRLGSPSISDFSVLVGRRAGNLEAGMPLCFIGQVMDQYQRDIDEDVVFFPMPLGSLTSPFHHGSRQ